jgi:glucokinase
MNRLTDHQQRTGVIGIDLGGTKLAGALFSSAGTLLEKQVAPLDRRRGSAVAELICARIASLLDTARDRNLTVSGIGVCVPGIYHSKTGRVWAPNIGGWTNYPLRREVQSAIARRNIRVEIDSDRACCILGETWRGGAKNCGNAIFLAVGTGIGAGILIDGRVLRGTHDIAGATGWLALDRPFRREYVPCGCFEHHASGEGLAKVAREIIATEKRYAGELKARPALTAQDVFAAYESGDKVARKVLEQAVEFWGMAVANLVSLFNPETIIFGGGVFGPARQFLGAIRAEARKWAQPISMRRVKLTVSKLGGDAGLHGAAYLALRRLEEKT